MRRAKPVGFAAAAAITVSLLAGCGEVGDKGAAHPIVIGSTDNRMSTLDPAGTYDIGPWTLFTNTFQTLLRFPQDGSVPQPEAAERCEFTDQTSTEYRCTMRTGLKFANGHTLDAEDVEFSIQRIGRIADDGGPASLFSNIDRVEAPDETTVVFHLRKPDAMLPFILATPAASIVDSEVYPPDRLIGKDQIAGSGPYVLDTFERAKGDPERILQAVFTRNTNYSGTVKPRNDAIRIRYFDNPDAMVTALREGEIDLTHRTLEPRQIATLAQNPSKDIRLVEAPGTEIRYLAFNTGRPEVEDPAVRRAMAQVIDRKALVRDVYQRTAEPLYSLIPRGVTSHTNAFYNEYGDPSVAKAREILQKAGVQTPVELTLWYTSDHYGQVTKDEFAELKRQLEAGGLFRITLSSRTWPAYLRGLQKGEYAVFGMGWFPDFPDPDNYTAPFLGKDNVLKSPYRNEEIIEEILPRSRRESQRGSVVDEFTRAQEIVAKDVPVLPLWQGKQYVAARGTVTGVEWTLDLSSTFHFWGLGRKGV